MYLLIKVHKKNFPGRAVVNQIDDPTYKICKMLTNILNPLATQSRSYVENSFELKNTLKSITVHPDDIQASFDARALVYQSKRNLKSPERAYIRMNHYKHERNGSQMISLHFLRYV